jgi:four helix bundle protein
MATIRSFEEIKSWQKSREVCSYLGVLIDQGRFGKNYRLIHQVEGSSGSIMDNIAEGFERGTRAEFTMFLGYAKGSCGELRSQLYRAFDRKYIAQEEFEFLISSVKNISRLLQKMIEYLLRSNIDGIRRKNGPKEP